MFRYYYNHNLHSFYDGLTSSRVDVARYYNYHKLFCVCVLQLLLLCDCNFELNFCCYI